MNSAGAVSRPPSAVMGIIYFHVFHRSLPFSRGTAGENFEISPQILITYKGNEGAAGGNVENHIKKLIKYKGNWGAQAGM